MAMFNNVAFSNFMQELDTISRGASEEMTINIRKNDVRVYLDEEQFKFIRENYETKEWERADGKEVEECTLISGVYVYTRKKKEKEAV